jgi:hypothetical protein
LCSNLSCEISGSQGGDNLFIYLLVVYLTTLSQLLRIYSRSGQPDQLRKPHFRGQQSSSHSSCKCILIVAMLSKNRKCEDENKEFETEWEEKFEYVQRNQFFFEHSTIIKGILRNPHH